MKSESKPRSSTVARELLDAACALRAVPLPDVGGQEDPEPTDFTHVPVPPAPASSAVVLGVALLEEGRAPSTMSSLSKIRSDASISAASPHRCRRLGRQIDQALGLAHRERAARGDLLADRVGRGEASPRRHDLVDEPDPLGLVGVEDPAGQDQLLGPRRADDPWQALRPTRARASPPGGPPAARAGPAPRRSAGRSTARARARRRARCPRSRRSSASAARPAVSRRPTRARAARGHRPRWASNSPTCDPAENARSPARSPRPPGPRPGGAPRAWPARPRARRAAPASRGSAAG